MDHYIEELVDLLDPARNRFYNVTLEEARRRVLTGPPEAVRAMDGSFALAVRDGQTVRLARSLDLLAMVMIGGLGSYHGGLAGAAIIVGLRFFFSRGFGPWLTVIIGGLLIVFTLFFPRGIAWGLTLNWHKRLQLPYLWALKAIRRWRTVMDGKFIEVNGKRMYYVERGEGRPLVLVHGNTGSSRWYSRVMDMPGYRTIAPEVRQIRRAGPHRRRRLRGRLGRLYRGARAYEARGRGP